MKNRNGTKVSQQSQTDTRVRKSGDGPKCAKCGSDMFATSTERMNQAYPGFLGKKIIQRRWKCGNPACGETGKTVTESPYS